MFKQVVFKIVSLIFTFQLQLITSDKFTNLFPPKKQESRVFSSKWETISTFQTQLHYLLAYNENLQRLHLYNAPHFRSILHMLREYVQRWLSLVSLLRFS